MTPTRIADLRAWEALDSRGRPTVGCNIHLTGGATGRAIVPSGASTGAHEAVELRDGGTRYAGWGVTRAVRNARTTLRDALIGLDAEDQVAVDTALERTDPDPRFTSVGSNAVLAASVAALLAVAHQRGVPLWQHLLGDASRPLIPMPMVNIVSGGAHAAGAVDIQDVLVIPVNASSFAEAIEWAQRVRLSAVELMSHRGGPAHLVADEGGLADRFGSNEEALELVTMAIPRAGLEPGRDVVLAVDVAAGQLWRDGAYWLASEGKSIPADQWIQRISHWMNRFPVASIEDPLHEDDWNGWQLAKAQLPGTQLVGDDLFATDLQRLETGHRLQAANSVLVKPNQAGTLTRALGVLRAAQAFGWSTVVSARSGDTEDHWLADLAIGWRAGQIKVGSTMRSERTAKWNRLLEIESTQDSLFAGREALSHR